MVWRKAWQNKGLSPSSSFPPFNYKAFDTQKCNASAFAPNTRVFGIGIIDANEPALKCHVATKGVAVVTVPAVFKNYKSGIFGDSTRNCKRPAASRINHLMVVVGYGTANIRRGPVDYWILRNSWGTNICNIFFSTSC